MRFRTPKGIADPWRWLPPVVFAAITVLHYTAPVSAEWVHDLARRLYYLPLVLAGWNGGVRWGLAMAAAVTAAYLPHAFWLPHHLDPGSELEKSLEIGLYWAIGGISGALADRLRRQARRVQRMYETHERMLEELVAAGRLAALGELVAGVAHEIKNPLHTLAATAEVVDPHVGGDAEVRALWETHKGEIDRLQRITARFLDFARPKQPAVQPCDLRDVAARVEELVAAASRKQRIRITRDAPRSPVSALADPDQLVQVGVNIALNAAAVLTDGGTIHIRTWRDPATDTACLSLSNDGPPIPDSLRARLFDPFVGTSGGTGLGLAISRRIVTANGGTLVLEPGMPVCFTVRLPVALNQPASTPLPHQRRSTEPS